MKAQLRVARPTDDIEAVVAFYRDGLDFEVIGSFGGHGGIDGVMLGHPEYDYHLEFTHHSDGEQVEPPSANHLLVFYLPDDDRWQTTVDRLESGGYERVASDNPYWDERGATFLDPDNHRVVLENADWTPAPVQP